MKKILLISILACILQSANSQQLLLVSPSIDTSCLVSSPFPTTYVNNAENLVAAYWTGSGSPGAWRAYFKMGFSLPPQTIIDSAFFSLYADNSSIWGNPGNPNFGTQNSAMICRVTSPWSSNLLWGTQPVFNNSNAAIIPQSSSTFQDYEKIDAKQLIQDVVNSGFNYGFLLKLSNEVSYYNSQIFHSSSSPEENKRPQLKIYYRYPTSLDDIEVHALVSIQHNGTHINVRNPHHITINQYEIYSTQGQLITQKKVNSNDDLKVSFDSYFSPGVYIFRLVTEKGILVDKFLYQ